MQYCILKILFSKSDLLYLADWFEDGVFVCFCDAEVLLK